MSSDCKSSIIYHLSPYFSCLPVLELSAQPENSTVLFSEFGLETITADPLPMGHSA